MKFKLIILVLFLVPGLVAFGREKQTENDSINSSQVIEKGLVKVSIMYPYEEGKTFDFEYYESKHMPMVAGYLGSNLVKYTIEKGIASGIPNTPLAYIAIGAFYVKDLGEYQAAIGPNRDAIRSDFVNYTEVTPMILISEVIR